MSVDGIKEVQKLIKRKPVIWDNIHANDYDQTRLYLGPYDGRPVDLQSHIGGVLTNPNCEFEANFIAMHTLAQWSLDTVKTFYKGNATYLNFLFTFFTFNPHHIKFLLWSQYLY